MSKADTWMPLHIGDYLSDTGHLRTVEHGAYLLLLVHYWRSGPLPDDDGRLAAIARMGRKEWSEVSSTIREFFTSADGRLHQKRADKERAKAAALSDKRKTVAEARWGSKEKQTACNEDAIASPIADQKHTPVRSRDLNLNLPSESSLRSERASRTPEPKGCRLPDDWNPGPEGAKFARDLGLNPETTFAKFRDYWRGKPGSQGRKLDWPGTWRNWCRKEAEDRGTAPIPRDGIVVTHMPGALF